MTSDVSVIIPAFNEEKGVASVVKRILGHLDGRAEVIVIDDCSTDKTSHAAQHAGATVIRHPVNAGYGRSLKTGILAASNENIVIADADGTYPVERIGDLVGKLDEGFDMIVGARSGMNYRGSFLKMPARIVFKFLVEFSTGRRIPDINSGFRAFRKTQVMQYFDDLCDGFSFTTTITLIYFLTGKFVAYIPIKYDKRIGSSKIRIMRDSLRTLQYIVEVLLHYNPLKLFLLLAIIICAMGFAGAYWHGKTTVIAGIVLSIAVMVLGFIAESVRFNKRYTR